MKHVLQVFFLLFLIISCEETYDPPPKALLQATLWSSSTKKAISPEVSVLGLGQDSLWIDHESTTSILFPLSKNDTSVFIVSFDSVDDTLNLSYQSELLYDAMETGFYYEYKLQSVSFTQNRIDSLIVIDSLITKNWNENFQLYINSLPDTTN